MNKTNKIYIAGHRGMVGSAIRRKLEAEGYTNLVVRTSKELDLRDQKAVNDFYKQEINDICDHLNQEITSIKNEPRD